MKLLRIIAFVLVMGFSATQAAVLEVAAPGEGEIGILGDVYPTIQAAIDDAEDGDTIEVHTGTYTEQLIITDKALTITDAGDGEVIIEADTAQTGAGNTFTINAPGKDITLSNLTIRHGDYGIHSTAGNVNVLHCTLYHNGWDGTGLPDPNSASQEDFATFFSTYATNGGAIRIENSNASEIAFCTIYENDRGIRYQDGANGNIHDNVSHHNIEAGIYLAASTYTGATGCVDTDVNNNQSYANMNNGILSIGGKNNTIRNNIVRDNWNSGVMLWHVAENTVQGNTIKRNNRFTFTAVGDSGDAKGGVWVIGDNSASPSAFVCRILSNTIADNQLGRSAQREGVRVGNTIPSDGIQIEGNTFTNHDMDIHVLSQPDTVTVTGNTFDASGIGIQNDDTSAYVDAELNWWGDATGPYDGSDDRATSGLYNPGGLGDQVSDYVDYIPWYTDANMAGECSVYILETGIYYPSIQAAVAAAAAGQTIIVGPGTLVEDGQIVIDKNLTIKGQNPGKPVVKPNQNTSNSGDAKGWFLVNAGVVFDMENLVLDGSGKLVYQAIRQKGSGSVTGVDFKNILYNESGPDYSGVAMAAFGDGPVDVNGCTFENIGRVGVLYFGSGVAGSVFANNTYTGKGPGDWLDYGVEFGAGATGTITGCTITDCNGIASVDGSTSAGILVTTYYGEGTEAIITENNITNNTTGIAIGYDDSDTSVVLARRNKIAGNIEEGMDTKPNTSVDAELNWWGHASGPGGAGPGSGDAVSDYIDYTPWYCDEAMTEICGYEHAYSRSPDVAVDSSGNYWLAYTVAKNTTVLEDYTDLNAWHNAADSDAYDIYVKKASTVEDLLTAVPVKVSDGVPESGHLQREVGIAELAGIVYIFASTGRTSGSHVYYYYSSDVDGQNWTGPIEATDLGTSVLHVHATKANLGPGERIYVSGAMSGNEIRVWAFDGSSFTGPYIESGWGTGGPRLGQTVAIDNMLYTVAAHSSLKSIAVATTTDANTQADYNDIATSLPVGQADLSIDKVGDEYFVVSAPWDSNDTQWIDLYKSTSLGGPWTKLQLTDPNIGYWNYWPELVVSGGNVYMFYTDETGGTGQIAMLPIRDCSPGDMNEDCIVDFADFAIWADQWLECGRTIEGCD